MVLSGCTALVFEHLAIRSNGLKNISRRFTGNSMVDVSYWKLIEVGRYSYAVSSRKECLIENSYSVMKSES